MKILLIEDNIKLAENIATILNSENYLVECSNTGCSGLKKALSSHFDLIILDLALPDIDGIEVCKSLRSKGVNQPILMLTARINIESKVEGLDVGADDYLTKPFLMEELLARIRALLRRNLNQNQTKFIFNHVKVNLDLKKVWANEKEIKLSPIDFKIIEFLLKNKGKFQSVTDIYENVWGDNNSERFFSDTLKVHIATIRQKLGKELIRTVNGFGYIID